MGASAFAGCTHISYLSIPFIGALPNGTENMHFGYIFGATGYEAHATVIPSTLTTLKISGNTTIADYALAHCASITEIEFSAGLESCISPKELTADVILSYVRALEETAGGVIRSMYKLVDGQIEAIEFWAKDDGKVIGVPLSKLQLKKGLLIAGIFRNGKILFPGGNDSIKPEDVVIVVTTNTHITSLDQILE